MTFSLLLFLKEAIDILRKRLTGEGGIFLFDSFGTMVTTLIRLNPLLYQLINGIDISVLKIMDQRTDRQTREQTNKAVYFAAKTPDCLPYDNICQNIVHAHHGMYLSITLLSEKHIPLPLQGQST